MTAPLAARKMPPPAPGEFRFVTKAISIEKSEDPADTRRRFKMVASSTVVDESNDEIKMSALQDLERDYARGVNIFVDHDHKVENIFGRTDYAKIMATGELDEKTGQPVYDLHIGGVVNAPNPRMVMLADSIDGDYVTFGASIGARVRNAKRNKDGGMDIYRLAGKEASLVGIPDNQRSWTYKAAKAARALDAAGDDLDLEEDDEDEDETQTEADGVEIGKADMSAETRNNLPDSAFACPEKRKYPINDKAHVRAALSRIADPNNDQCGRSKILAAARRMGIGDHGDQKAASMSDDDLLMWAMNTDNGSALQVQGLCKGCGHGADCNCTDCDCGDAMHMTKNLAADDLTTKATEEAADSDEEPTTEPAIDADVQESAAAEIATETPETPAAEEEDETTDTPVEEKAFSFAATDVVELAHNAGNLARGIAARDEEIALLKAENDRLTAENEEAKKLIEKVLALPLRPRAVAAVSDLNEKLPEFLAPEVREFLTKSAGETR